MDSEGRKECFSVPSKEDGGEQMVIGANPYNGEVVISGISCRFPESDNMQEFRDNLMNGVDMVTEDDRRWRPGVYGLPRRHGKLKDISKFDAAFFGVHPKQATLMDPQMRNMLELTYEAIIDAGVDPATIQGSNTGVFLGGQQSESASFWPRSAGGYVLPGNAAAMFANRISFFFDFKGPSNITDTACSSSIYALNQALKSIRCGDCDSAIVGGSILCLSPDVAVRILQLGMLSMDGMCKSFDKNGKGYCRSEGISIMYLQKQAVAKRIYCTVVHTKVNADGNKEQGITFPSGDTQRSLLEATYKEAGVDPLDVAYVEAHATGTPAGDPEEGRAISDVFCQNRESPLLIGSVKSNMGHCECASGMASLAKVIIAMEENVIPANLHFSEPNENIPYLLNGKLQVVAENKPWGGGIAALNSFGFGGANSHAILRSNSLESRVIKEAKEPRLFIYGSRTQDGVESMLNMVMKYPQDIHLHKLLNETAFMSIDTHPYRGFTVLNNGQNNKDIKKASSEKKPVWFVFSGMGSQWSGMGKKMMEIDVFRNSIFRSDAILKQHGVHLQDMILNEEDLSEDVMKSFVGITSIQVALVDMLACLGITPDGIVGHSVGELACAYADGSLTAEEAVLAAYWRGICVQNANLPPGGMAAVGLTWQEAFKQCPRGVVPACHNSENSVTVSGQLDDVKSFVEVLEKKGTFAKLVQSAGVAFHSYFMQDVAPALKSALDKIITPKPRSERWISSSYQAKEWSTDVAKMSSASYHVHNLVSPVLFQEALSHVPSNAVVIEISPHGLLQSILKTSFGSECCIVGMMKRNNPDNVDFCLTSLGKCYQNGVKLDPLKLLPPVEFPVPRGTPMISPAVRWDHSVTWAVAGDDEANEEGSSFDIDLSEKSEYRYFLEHKIDGRPLLPGAVYLMLVWKALANREGKQYDQMPVIFEGVRLHRASILTPDTEIHIDVKFISSTNEFQVVESNEVVVSGQVSAPDTKAVLPYFNKDWEEEERKELNIVLDPETLYKCFRMRGFEYGPAFRLLLGANKEGDHGRIQWKDDWITFIDVVTQLPILDAPGLYLPTGITKVVIDPFEHRKRLQTLEDGTQGADVFIGRANVTRRAGGIHIHGATSTQARRTEQKPATHEAFKFIPYTLSLVKSSENEAVYKYAEILRTVLSSCLKNGQINLLGETISHSENTKAESSDLDTDLQEWQKKSSYPKKQAILEVLKAIAAISNEDKSREKIRDILKSKADDLQCDMLLDNLLQASILRPCIDTVKENSFSETFKVIEITKANWSDNLLEFFTNQASISYTVATVNPDLRQRVSVKGTVKEVVDWEPGCKVPDNMGTYDLIVANNILRRSGNIREALTSMQKVLDDDGFILVHEVTTNFHTTAILDEVWNVTDLKYNDLNERTCCLYCDASKWRQIFSEEGLEVIQEFSDKLLSSLFLLRKKSTNQLENQTVLDVTDPTCNWVEELKTKIAERGEDSRGECLWLKSDDNISGVLGLVSCLRKEHENIRCILNMDGDEELLDRTVMESLVRRNLVVNVYKNGQWGSYSHIPIDNVPLIPSAHAYVNYQNRGNLSSLTWLQSPLKHRETSTTAATEICNVHYASLNFRDVMLASGKLPVEAIPVIEDITECLLGMEFSGTDHLGHRVMGLVVNKGLATTIETQRKLLWSVPDDWSLEEAATVPLVYSTAFYALVVRGNIRPGMSVLIHSGSGGVGQAAISIALQYGCTVFTTVGSMEKRAFLKMKFPALNDSSFFSSRDTGFELGILKATKGRGVDIVLNSLAEEKLQASVRALAMHGKFLEIGKYDLSKNSALGMSAFLKNITFHGILLDALFDAESEDLAVVARCLTQGIQSGTVRPLNSTVFGADDVQGAFRYMSKGTHIGKILIKVRSDNLPVLIPAFPRSSFHPEKVYIVTGGLGGFGLELAQWLVNRGARHLILTSRSGFSNNYQMRMVESLKVRGAEVVVSTKNLCDMTDLRQLFKDINDRAVGGVFHLAAVLKDGLFENQTQETFQTVCDAKVTGTINLDHVTRELCKDSLDWFVAFSSVSSGYGNAGQTNYGFANSSLERIIEQRRRDGYPGLAIQWGPVGDVGMYQSLIGDDGMVLAESTRYVPQRILSCLHSLDLLLNQSEPVVCSYVKADISGSSSKASREDLVQCICNILGINDPDSVDENRSFGDIGLDSLLGVEVKLTLEKKYDIVLGPKEIRALTVKKLKAFSEDQGQRQNDMSMEEYIIDGREFPLFEMLGTEIIVKMNSVDKGSPLFIIHHVFGSVNGLLELVSQLKVPVFGIQRTTAVPHESVAAMAHFYLQAIKNFCPNKDFHLAGYSFGACVALEMALQMQEEGHSKSILSLTLLDGFPNLVPKFPKQMQQDDNHEMNVLPLFEGKQGEKEEDVLEEAAQKLLLFRPEITITEARSVSLASFMCFKLAANYQLAGIYQRDITLVLSESSTLIPDIEPDAGLGKVCTGKVTVEVVPGNHISFLLKKSGVKVASILNSILCPGNES